jgi:hypothetical protein
MDAISRSVIEGGASAGTFAACRNLAAVTVEGALRSFWALIYQKGGQMGRIAARVIAVVVTLVAGGAVAALVLGGGSGSDAGSGGAAGGATRTVSGTPGQQAAAIKAADPRVGLPTVTPKAVTTISYAPAPSAAKARFASVLKASGGLVVSSKVSSVKLGGAVVGVVGVYATKPGLAKSSTFQDQYVVQLMQAVTKDKGTPRFVRVNGRVVALSNGAVPVAGWFEGDRVVLVYRQGRTPDLAGLALGVLRAAEGR